MANQTDPGWWFYLAVGLEAALSVALHLWRH